MCPQNETMTDHLHLDNNLERWLAYGLHKSNPEEGIQSLLESLGKEYLCERTYVFEIDYESDTISNTYEWCADGIIPQKENLQKEPIFQVEYWMKSFEKKDPVIIKDLEEQKSTHPATYAILKPQGISTLIAVPIFQEDSLMGFLGMDNVDFTKADSIIPILFFIGSLFSHILQTRDMMNRIQYLKFHDQLTLSLNRNALDRDLHSADSWTTLGVLSCDISELKRINESLGYDFGDSIICEWSSVLKRIFHDYKVYRVSGDNFLIICPNIAKKQFMERIAVLDAYIDKNKQELIFGSSWSDTLPIRFEDVLMNAKQVMFENKYRFFHQIDPTSGRPRERRIFKAESLAKPYKNNSDSILNSFIDNNYFNLDSFFKAMSIGGLYPYFGDLTSNNWYISDSMKELLGINTNIIPNLLEKWEEYIPYKEDLELFRSDIANLMELKREIHDLVYRIEDKDGTELWIRCFGLVTWDKEKTVPLFFCGNVFRLNYAFVVDPITNFPREKAAIREIGKLQQSNHPLALVCFRLNGFSEINELRGRNVANNLLKDISSTLAKTFDKEIQFYRLDGLRFLAIVPKKMIGKEEELSQSIRDSITEMYQNYNLPVRSPCSIGILNDVSKNIAAQEIMTDIMSMLEIAKNSGEDKFVYSSHTVRLHREQKQMIMDLSNDTANNFRNFRVLIQPIVSLKNHKIVGGEVLLRWKYEGSDVSPMFFIPVLEETKLILPVGRWIFDQTARYCKRIQAHIPDFFLDFNVSYHQINDGELIPSMIKSLENWDLQGTNLVMELTETHYNDSPVKLQEFIEHCKQLGMRMALDDFGVGYSSLEMLLRYPANIVKLDRSLMKKMSDSTEISDFITTIVYACHKFGKLVCVEGVETEQELKIVTDAGCDMVQGFYFHRPMEVQDLYLLLSKDLESN